MGTAKPKVHAGPALLPGRPTACGRPSLHTTGERMQITCDGCRRALSARDRADKNSGKLFVTDVKLLIYKGKT